MVCLELSKDFFGFDKDILYIALYVPPYGSPYYKVTESSCMLHSLEDLLLNMQQNGDRSYIDINGDLNARLAIGTGKLLIDFFITFDCFRLNGAHSGDQEGKFTYVDSQGNSVIDYAIVSAELLMHNSISFEIGSRVESPHMPIQPFSVKKYAGKDDIDYDTQNEYLEKTKWDNEKADVFLSIVNSEETMAILNEATDLVDRNIDAALDTFNQTLLEAGKCMKRTFPVNKPGKENSNKWFDRDCRSKKEEAKTALRAFHAPSCVKPKQELKQAYNQKRKEYKSILNEKKKAYKTRVHQTLKDSRYNSKMFWSTIRAARQKREPKQKLT